MVLQPQVFGRELQANASRDPQCVYGRDRLVVGVSRMVFWLVLRSTTAGDFSSGDL